MYSQIHEIVHSNYMGVVLLASMYNNQRQKKQVNPKHKGTNDEWGRKECETRRQEVEISKNHKLWKDLWNQFGGFMRLLEVKVHYHKIEECHMSSWLGRIMNQSKRFVKLIKHFGSSGWKVHKLAWNLHEIAFAFMRSHLTRGVYHS